MLSFLGAWLLAFMDHRATLWELVLDPGGLLFGMLLAGTLLFLLYHLLRLVFSGFT